MATMEIAILNIWLHYFKLSLRVYFLAMGYFSLRKDFKFFFGPVILT